MIKELKNLISQMTIEEKASLCSGATVWKTKAIERLQIPSIMMSDGPHGLRKQLEESDHLGLKGSVPATCFPTASALASSWDIDLVTKVGKALGRECQSQNVNILLGPGINIKRSPLCGRNFEYFSEDPLLSGELGVAWVSGVQSQGVGASLKHYVANNQEYQRLTIDALIDERTLREIYLSGFERVVKEAGPWTVMCAYNRVNGTYCSESHYLLTEILREEWGFEGFVVSDWGAVDLRVNALQAGLDLEMPTTNGLSDQKVVAAVKAGQLSEQLLDQTVENILRIVLTAVQQKREDISYDQEEHHQLAREIAADCIILLRNEDSILPLNKDKLARLAVIGRLAKLPRYQGSGSSRVNAAKLENAYQEIEKITAGAVRVDYADGYQLEHDQLDQELINQAKKVAAAAEVAVIFAGLPERYESEGYDREHINIPLNQQRLIEEVVSVQKNVVVVLNNGAVVNMRPWNNKVKGLLEGWLTGQAGGGAVADVLFGRVNPSAKLAETIPLKLSDYPAYLNYPGKKGKVKYQEGIFVGYRYYDAKDMEVLYPFGYGLSYTSFAYSDLQLSKKEMNESERLLIKVKVKNTGDIAGKEIIQLYLRDLECREIRPEKELKAFTKVALKPGEEKEVTLVLEGRDFAYYEEEIKDWYVESGDFEILIGKSSRELILRDIVHVKGRKELKSKYDRNTTIGELMKNPLGAQIVKQMMIQFKKKSGPGLLSSEVMEQMMQFMPLRSLIALSNGLFTEELMEGLLNTLNNPNKLKYNLQRWLLGLMNK